MNLVKKGDARIDRVLGVKKLAKGFKLGDGSFSHDDKYFLIKGDKYEITPGLTDLIFNKNPNDNIINENNRTIYRSIISKTHALNKGYKPNQSPRKDKEEKFKNYFSKNFGGSSFEIEKRNGFTECVRWNNSNELVKRLKL